MKRSIATAVLGLITATGAAVLQPAAAQPAVSSGEPTVLRVYSDYV